MVNAQPGASLWPGWQPSLWPRVHWSGSNSTRIWYLVWVLPFLNIRQTCSQLSCINSHWKTQAILGERKQMQVRVCMASGGKLRQNYEGSGMMVGEARVSAGPRPQKSKAKANGFCLIFNPFPAKRTVCSSFWFQQQKEPESSGKGPSWWHVSFPWWLWEEVRLFSLVWSTLDLLGETMSRSPFSLDLGVFIYKRRCWSSSPTMTSQFSQVERGCRDSTSQKQGHWKGPRKERELGRSKDLN